MILVSACVKPCIDIHDSFYDKGCFLYLVRPGLYARDIASAAQRVLTSKPTVTGYPPASLTDAS